MIVLVDFGNIGPKGVVFVLNKYFIAVQIYSASSTRLLFDKSHLLESIFYET